MLKRRIEDKFLLLLIPCWFLAIFFFIAFLIQAGIPPQPISSLSDFTYLGISLLFIIIPFFSRIKIGKLLELERKINESKKDLETFKSDTRQMFTTLTFTKTSSQSGPIYINSHTIEGRVDATDKQIIDSHGIERKKTSTELEILSNLWIYQVNKFPELNQRFGFKILAIGEKYLHFREAASRLIGEGLLDENDDELLFLTDKGLRYCKNNYKTFPPGMWLPAASLDEEKLNQVLKFISTLN